MTSRMIQMAAACGTEFRKLCRADSTTTPRGKAKRWFGRARRVPPAARGDDQIRSSVRGTSRIHQPRGDRRSATAGRRKHRAGRWREGGGSAERRGAGGVGSRDEGRRRPGAGGRGGGGGGGAVPAGRAPVGRAPPRRRPGGGGRRG